MARAAHLLALGLCDYREAWELQRSLAAAVTAGTIPDTVLFLEHPPTVTLGRRTDPAELHVPETAEVEIVETDRGGKSTYHAPGQLVCYPILDLNRHGRDVRLYCRTLEQAIIDTLAAFGIEAARIEGLTGVWVGASSARGPGKDRLDRRPHQPLGDHARLRAQRRPGSGAVSRLDHRLRARGRELQLHGPLARTAADNRRGATRCRCVLRAGLRARADGASERPARPLAGAARGRRTPRRAEPRLTDPRAAHPARRGCAAEPRGRNAMARAGIEPATPRFSAVCSTS